MVSRLTLAVFGALVTLVWCLPPTPDNQVCLMVPPSVDDCYRFYVDKPISDRAAQVVCLQQLLWNFEARQNFTEDDLKYFRETFGPGPTTLNYNPSTALPPSGYRKRREYRTLSDGERQRFHSAMDKLYEDGVIRRFAMLYQQSDRHRGGASFLPWVRVYLTMFEEALRMVNRHVFLPYWDCSIDYEMDNPVNSDIWTAKYFGTGTGEVVSGLGANYVTHQGHLERDYGKRGRLFSKQFIRNIITKCHMKDISKPTAKHKYDIERVLGGSQNWVGADMAYTSSAAFDPIFYLHLAYMDYIWELYRVNQKRSCDVIPELNYPDVDVDDSHHPDASMQGFEWLRNRDGIQDYWIKNWYQYETHPVCPDCCPTCQHTKPMRCDTRKNVCVARSRRPISYDKRPSAKLDKEQFYEMQELIALTTARSPRNRGIPMDHSPGDERTLFTAYDDAVLASKVAQEKAIESRTSGRRRSEFRDRPSRGSSLPQLTRGGARDISVVRGDLVGDVGSFDIGPSQSQMARGGVGGSTIIGADIMRDGGPLQMGPTHLQAARSDLRGSAAVGRDLTGSRSSPDMGRSFSGDSFGRGASVARSSQSRGDPIRSGMVGRRGDTRSRGDFERSRSSGAIRGDTTRRRGDRRSRRRPFPDLGFGPARRPDVARSGSSSSMPDMSSMVEF